MNGAAKPTGYTRRNRSQTTGVVRVAPSAAQYCTPPLLTAWPVLLRAVEEAHSISRNDARRLRRPPRLE
jgi:hypothetical protein